jgi:predicted  nucleic acid-binding Zn-ribbon protein
MSQPFKLLRLQQIDSQLDQKQARLVEIEHILQDESQLQAAQALLAERQQTLQDAQRVLRHAEAEVQTQRIKIEQNQAALYGGKIRNPKELQDLQNEDGALKRYLSVLEDRQLEAMIIVEEAEAEQSRSTQALGELQARRIENNATLLGEQSALLKDVARLEDERTATASSIDEADIQLYEGLRVSRRGNAVARIQDNACAACGSTLTPAIIQATRSGSGLTRCTFCGRILYMG